MGKRLTQDGFIWVEEKVLPPYFCRDLIHKFDNHPDPAPGETLGGFRPDKKQSVDLYISVSPDFSEEDQLLRSVLKEATSLYLGQLDHVPWRGPLGDTGYNMQRTSPGGFYDWHHDHWANSVNNYIRVITVIWYLNTINDGGHTEFINGVRVQPEEGKMLMFPSDYQTVHRGVSPASETKYIVTGWIHEPLDQRFTLEQSP